MENIIDLSQRWRQMASELRSDSERAQTLRMCAGEFAALSSDDLLRLALDRGLYVVGELDLKPPLVAMETDSGFWEPLGDADFTAEQETQHAAAAKAWDALQNGATP